MGTSRAAVPLPNGECQHRAGRLLAQALSKVVQRDRLGRPAVPRYFSPMSAAHRRSGFEGCLHIVIFVPHAANSAMRTGRFSHLGKTTW